MEKTTQKKNRSLRRIAPVRLGIMLFALAAVATISSLRGSDEAMVWVYDHITHPYHVFMSQFCSNVSFSVAEFIYAASILGLAAYILWCVYRMIFVPETVAAISPSAHALHGRGRILGRAHRHVDALLLRAEFLGAVRH